MLAAMSVRAVSKRLFCFGLCLPDLFYFRSCSYVFLRPGILGTYPSIRPKRPLASMTSFADVRCFIDAESIDSLMRPELSRAIFFGWLTQNRKRQIES